MSFGIFVFRETAKIVLVCDITLLRCCRNPVSDLSIDRDFRELKRYVSVETAMPLGIYLGCPVANELDFKFQCIVVLVFQFTPCTQTTKEHYVFEDDLTEYVTSTVADRNLQPVGAVVFLQNLATRLKVVAELVPGFEHFPDVVVYTVAEVQRELDFDFVSGRVEFRVQETT